MVRNQRLRLHIPALRPLPISKRWKNADYKLLGTMSDADAARRLKRTWTAVQARRIILGIPKFKAQFHPWTDKEEALLGAMSDHDLAARLGISIAAVAHRRWRKGIPVHFANRHPWTPQEDALLGTAGDTAIAALLRRHVSVVCIRRQKLGIANPYWQSRCGRQRKFSHRTPKNHKP